MTGDGVVGTSNGNSGVYGQSRKPETSSLAGGVGVQGQSWGREGVGVFGQGAGPHGYGIIGLGETTGIGVSGTCPNVGVQGLSNFGTGVLAVSSGTCLAAKNRNGLEAYLASMLWAGEFVGPVLFHDAILKAGGGFLIDHPLDPANKYLHHSFVESPDRKNVYDGISVLDGQGEAVVKLPEWFSALNRDFRYQLTCLGGHAPVFVAQEIEDNCFRIAGGSPGLRVSWLVTGIRQDPWASANIAPPEQDKPEAERGSFLHPALYDQPEDKGVQRLRHPATPVQLPQDLLSQLATGEEKEGNR